MAGAIIGGLLGMAFGESLVTWGFLKAGMAGLGWLFGASVGSLFDQPSLDFGTSSPNYSFSEIYNTKSQLLPVPVVYGRVRVAGNIFMQQFYDDTRQKMDMFVGLSNGPINRVISVYANEHVLYGDGSGTQNYWMLVNGEWVEGTYEEYLAFEGTKEIRDEDGNPVTVNLRECSCDIHLGEATQLKDTREPGEYAYPYTAYLGLTLNVQEGLTGNPTITTELEGRKIWTPAGERYTTNPVWCIRDLLTNPLYGVGLPAGAINAAAAADAAAFCDQLVEGRPRYSLNYVLDTQRPAPDALRDMCMCFDGYFRERETIEICVNRPSAAPSATIDTGRDIVEGSFTWWKKGREDTYNRIVIEWVDPENFYERTSTPFEDEADIIARGLYERNISLLGVTDAYQAGRLGEQALNIAQRIKNYCSFRVSVGKWDLEIGDVIAVTDSALTGWSSKWFHVIDAQDDPDAEEATISCVEYSPSSYVDVPSILPWTPDNPPPAPATDNYSNLILTDVGTQERDGTYVPKVRVQYAPPAAEMAEHVVTWWHDEESVSTKKVAPQIRDVLISEGIRTGVTLTVHVWGVDVNGKRRTGVVGQITPGKDDVAPGAPTSLTALGWFGEIILNWINPETNEDGTPCTDLAYVEVWESSQDDISTAVLVGQASGTSFRRYLGSFEGRYYWVRAVDTSGNVSQWNAEAGTYGYSDLESAEDFWRAIMTPEIEEALADLSAPIDALSEASIWNALSDYQDAIKENLRQRYQDKLAEAAIQAELGGLNDVKHSLATIAEERLTRETEDEALASRILTIAAMLGDPENPGEGTVYAAIVSERTARVTADEALALNIDALTAVIGDPWNPGEGTVYAAIRTEQTARATTDEALASDISSVAASIGDPANPAPGTVYAAVKNETTRACGRGRRARIQRHDPANAGRRQHRRCAAGHAVGGRHEGQMGSPTRHQRPRDWARTDRRRGEHRHGVQRRSVHYPDPARGTPPFMLGTVDGITRVVLKNVFMEDGSITNAKIKDLTVERIKLASGAPGALTWGVTSGYQWPQGGEQGYVDTWTERVMRDLQIDTTGAVHVLVQAYVRSTVYGGNKQYAKLTKNGGSSALGAGGTAWLESPSNMIINYMDTSPGSGTQIYQVKSWVASGSGYVVTGSRDHGDRFL